MRNNPIIVQKYGGACLETPAKIRAVASSLADLHSRGHRVVAIVSAMGKKCGNRGAPRQPLPYRRSFATQ
jgi:aspartokinase